MEDKYRISSMFSRIAKRYNLANDFLSFGIHRLWKKKAIELLALKNGEKVLDLCCGTGDFLKRLEDGIGIDISGPMLLEARKNLKNSHPLVCADGEDLPFKEDSFHKVIMGFGIRNISNVLKALSAIHRILKPAGKLVILEFSKPRSKIFSKIYLFYLSKILPLIGGWISKDPASYHYLRDTIQKFPDGKEFLDLMRKSNFKNLKFEILSLGIASIYQGEK